MQPMQFSEEEVQNLREIFDLFDKQQVGSINIKDLEAIMQSLQRDPEEAKSLLAMIRQEQQDNMGDSAHDVDPETITFDDFLKMMEQVENNLAKDDPHNLNR